MSHDFALRLKTLCFAMNLIHVVLLFILKFSTMSVVLIACSDVKFREIFCPEIFHELFHEIFQKYFKNFRLYYV